MPPSFSRWYCCSLPVCLDRAQGVIGTLAAALIFASFLFSPMGNIHVADEAARGNLGWMMLIGIGFSFLFAPPTSVIHRHYRH